MYIVNRYKLKSELPLWLNAQSLLYLEKTFENPITRYHPPTQTLMGLAVGDFIFRAGHLVIIDKTFH